MSVFRELFPRWKECVLLFLALAAVTVFVPSSVGFLVFVAAAFLVGWRGYREESMPVWINLLRLGMIGFFVGTLLWGVIVHPLQREAIIWASRQVHIAKPEWLLCCIWDDQEGDRSRK